MFSVGSSVCITNYPQSGDPFNLLNYNGKVGVIKSRHSIGISVKNEPIYNYEVIFTDIEVASITRDANGRLLRTVRRVDAINYFDETYLRTV